MTLNRPRSLATIETPIERMFRRIMTRPMTKSERRTFHLKGGPRIRSQSRGIRSLA
jgi:hypothetical protein